MARSLRIQYEGAVYHVTSRGNAGNPVFLGDDDRILFLRTLDDAVERSRWICHAYCLMSNHYHLLIETPQANLARGMRHLNGVYTQSYNRVHHRQGHLLQGRYKAILVQKESHLLEVARYIVLNPVRACVVEHPREWRWSSYRATSGECPAPRFLTVEWILARIDGRVDRAVQAYRRFVKDGKGIPLWDDLQGGVLLGSEAFAQEMRPLLRSVTQSQEFSRAGRMLAHPSLEELLEGASENRVLRDQRIYEAHRVHGYTLFELQEHLGLHYSTISRIVKRVGEERTSKNKT